MVLYCFLADQFLMVLIPAFLPILIKLLCLCLTNIRGIRFSVWWFLLMFWENICMRAIGQGQNLLEDAAVNGWAAQGHDNCSPKNDAI